MNNKRNVPFFSGQQISKGKRRKQVNDDKS